MNGQLNESAEQKVPPMGHEVATPMVRPVFIRAISILALIFALILLEKAFATHHLKTAYSLNIVGISALGFACAGACLAKGWFTTEPKFLLRARNAHLLVSFTTVAIVLFISTFGMHQFGGFDHSAMIDVGWRMINHQQIYRDFPYPLPIGFTLGTYYAFQFFGVSWQSLVTIAALFAAGTFLWSYWLLRRLLFHRFMAWLVAFFMQASSLMLVAYWWYNPITTLSGVVFFLSAAYFLRNPQSRPAQGSYFFALLLLASMKPNIAGVLIAGASIVLFTSKPHRWRVVALSAAAFGCFLLWLAAHRISLGEVLGSYFSVATRGLSLKQFLQYFSPEEKCFSIACAGYILVPLVLAKEGHRALWRGSRLHFLALAAILAGLYGFLTNGETKLVDLGLAFFGVFFYCTARDGRGFFACYLGFIAVVLLFVGLAQGITRQRVKGIGLFFEYKTVSQPIPNAFFRGVTTGPKFHEVVAEVADILKRSPTTPICFGPRMQWAYAAFHLPPPIHQPVWWHPGVSFPAEAESAYMRAWDEMQFEQVVLFGSDKTYYSSEYIDLLKRKYECTTYSRLTVLVRKPKASPE